ncbi:serine/arginine repetitive matrix protein 2 isoform X2 [Betta splendens]|uniref:Serine/arginine repetitive matrix protein 2 isoform X2 n=1 Tax=Betta splendens TaxID=158456 RepID=A0A6P7KLS5_BETSP|nr:serine/arginine repetitive matrix protein 2 isoform X2 [Betta splendens]
MSLNDSEGVIRSDEHGDLPFDIKENFSDVEFTAEDINEEVEFTVITLKSGKRAVRICRVKEPLLLTLCTATAAAASEQPDANASSNGKDNSSSMPAKGKTEQEVPPNMMLDPELYEGIVSQPIIEPTATLPGYPGQIHANIGPVRTNVTFNHRDCGVTLLKNDHVLINLLIDRVTRKRRAANIKPKIPFTFSYTKETREMGVITFLGPKEGILSSENHGELPFDVCENFSDSEFNSNDIDKDVEFTPTIEKGNKKAIRLRRIKRMEDKILEEQKKREEEEKRKKWEEEERKRQEEEKEAERKKKEEVAAALAAAKGKWTPLGFSLRDPHSLDDVSKERFDGTVLRAISKHPPKVIKKEPVDHQAGGGAQEEKDGNKAGQSSVKEEEEELKKNQSDRAADVGRLVMTVDGEQKQLSFEPKDLLTTATMLDGDKVRFNIATHRETKEERATYVEILPASFEESIEQRRNGIVIEFSEDSGLIKCSQNPQLYFHMSEVIEKKKLELNEKVEFSVVPHETADGGHQAIRIKRYTESVFFPVRKLCGVGANKGKMTIKLTKPSEDTEKENPETDKLKAVVKSLRAQDNKTRMSRRDCNDTRRRYGWSRSRSRSKSRSRSRSNSRTRSPPRDQFGRVIKRRRSISNEREHKSSRHKQSRSREQSHRRTRSRSRSLGKSRSRSRSRSKDRSKDKPSKGSQASRDRDDSLKRRKDLSPPPRRSGTMDDELARKKRELEELNEMIAYKKSLVEIDPRGLDPGQRTCIDYDHGRIAVPLTEYRPVRSILKKRPETPEYHRHPSQSYDDHYYDQPYSQYPDRRYSNRYGDSYTSRSYPDRTYTKRAYESPHYGEPPYGGPTSICRYTDRYDVYDEPYDDSHYEPAYRDQPYNNPYQPLQKQNHSHEPPSQSGRVLASAQPPLNHSAATLPSQAPFKPPSPTDSPPTSSSPKLKNMSPAEKPPLDRFLDMLNKKVDSGRTLESVQVNDDLLPHERALQDGRGFSQIVGLTREQPSVSQSLKGESIQLSPKQYPLDGKSKEPKSTREPYDKIQSLLRTIGLKLSTGDASKLAGRGHDKINDPKSSSTERSTVSFEREELRTSRTGSVESDHVHSPSPVRSSSLEPLSRHRPISHYEGFLDQEELKELKKAQQLQSFTKTMASVPSTIPPVKPLPGPPLAYYQNPHPSVNWPLGIASAQGSPSSNMTTSAPDLQLQRCVPPVHPPGPPTRCPGQSPPGPPPQCPTGHPLFTQSSSSPVVPFVSQSPTASSAKTIQLQSITTAAEPLPPPSSATSGTASVDQMAISTTVARCLKVIETVKSLAVQPPAKPAKSVQFSLPTESPLDSSPQTTTESDDDVKIKQNEKLDLFNRTALEKQEFQEMLADRKQGENGTDGTRSSSGTPFSSGPKNVWICGHSLVYWAESRAKSPEVGMLLGMDPSKVAIWWKGTQGMTWSQLLSQLHQLKVTWPNPDVLIVHLGGNDLSTDSPTDLLASVKKDLTSIKSIFPQCVLVWSNILPRRVWRHSTDSHEVDLVRTTVNRRIQNVVSELGGTSLTHDNIRCGSNTGLYRADGVHLSQKGIDTFNLNLQDFLEKWEVEVNKASEKD